MSEEGAAREGSPRPRPSLRRRPPDGGRRDTTPRPSRDPRIDRVQPRVTAADVFREGIRDVTPRTSIRTATRLRREAARDRRARRRRWIAHASPGDDPAAHPLAAVRDAFTPCSSKETSRRADVYGRGAGAMRPPPPSWATSSASRATSSGHARRRLHVLLERTIRRCRRWRASTTSPACRGPPRRARGDRGRVRRSRVSIRASGRGDGDDAGRVHHAPGARGELQRRSPAARRLPP